MNKIALIVTLLLTSFNASAFSSSLFSFVESKDTVKKHSPKKATLYSAVLPGLGQAYNRKYWKIPIVYAAIGTSAYFIKFNREEMLKRQNALTAMLDGDPNTVASDEFKNLPVDVLKAQRNNFRTNRDYSIIATAAFYLLNIVDATVDAHFYKFNIDQPLAIQKQRHWYLSTSTVGRTQTFGLAYRF